MNFSIGDRVRPIDDRDFNSFGEGTIVATYNDEGYYINWDNNNGNTYSQGFRRDSEVHTYTNIYMMFSDRVELVSDAIDRPPLPSDPRLRGICLKIRELDKKFKQRQQAKKDIPFEEAAQRAYDAYTTAGGTSTTYTPMYLNTVSTTY